MNKTNLTLITLSITACLLLAERSQSESLQFVPNPEKSSIQVDVKATTDSFVGILSTYNLTLSVNSSTGNIENCEFSFDFRDLDTGKAKRNAHMLEWLRYADYPKARFVLDKLEGTSETKRATGTLSVHGISKTITFPITIQQNDAQMIIDGRVGLNYHDFDLKTIRVMLILTVKPDFDVIIHLEGNLANARH